MKKKVIIKYSESFKIQVVKEYEESYLSLQEISRKYGITGGSTVSVWLKKYGSAQNQNKVVRVEKPEEKQRIKELEKEVKRLRAVLAKETIRATTNESMAQVIAHDLGVDYETIKKKVEEGLLS